VTPSRAASAASHPVSCPWCGQQRIHGVYALPSLERHYRCVACGTAFFINEWPKAAHSLGRLCPPSPGGLITPADDKR